MAKREVVAEPVVTFKIVKVEKKDFNYKVRLRPTGTEESVEYGMTVNPTLALAWGIYEGRTLTVTTSEGK